MDRVRRVNVTLNGDNAAAWDVCATTMGLSASGRNRSDMDEKILTLALHALEKVLAATSEKIGSRFPSYDQVRSALESADKAS